MSKKKAAAARGATRRCALQRQRELAWIKEARAWPRQHNYFCTQIVEKLRAHGAFDALRREGLSSCALEFKIAEVVAPGLWAFKMDANNEAIMTMLECKQQAFEQVAKSLGALSRARPQRWGSCKEQREAFSEAHSYKRKGERTAEQLAKSREQLRKMPAVRRADRLDRIHVNATIVIRSVTGASWNRVFIRLLPPILDALKTLYGPILPARGFRDPHTRYLKLISRARKPSPPSLTTSPKREHLRLERRTLERLEHRLLLSWDTRFSQAVRRGRYLHDRG